MPIIVSYRWQSPRWCLVFSQQQSKTRRYSIYKLNWNNKSSHLRSRNKPMFTYLPDKSLPSSEFLSINVRLTNWWFQHYKQPLQVMQWMWASWKALTDTKMISWDNNESVTVTEFKPCEPCFPLFCQLSADHSCDYYHGNGAKIP